MMREREALALLDELSNEGRWGPADERGTLNHIDPSSIRDAVSEVVEGTVVALAQPLTTEVEGFAHEMLHDDHADRSCQDLISVRPHGFRITHVDALAHGFFEGRVYNGRRAEDVVTSDGVRFGSIAALAGGAVARGVLLDVAASRGLDHLSDSDGISAEDLCAAEEHAGVSVRRGDVLCLRSGLGLRVARESADIAGMPREGLLADALPWLHEREIAALCADCIERLPSGYERLPMPLHQIGLSAMGLVMIDACDLELLARACRERGRATFLFVAAPLPIVGGTGSPVNPLAVF
jgi:kynurenine formamidase